MDKFTIVVMKRTIISIINLHSSLRDNELILELIRKMYPVVFTKKEYYEMIFDLVNSSEIFELEYTDLSQPNVKKSIYFRKDTIFLNLKVGDSGDSNKTVVDGESKRDT